MNYVGFMLRAKGCSCKLFLTHYLDAFGNQKGFLDGVSLPPEFPIQEINICITQSEEKYLKDYFQANISY